MTYCAESVFSPFPLLEVAGRRGGTEDTTQVFPHLTEPANYLRFPKFYSRPKNQSEVSTGSENYLDAVSGWNLS